MAKKKKEEVTMNEEFFKELYALAMIDLKAKFMSGVADNKDLNTLIGEIKRLEIAVYEDDIEVITSFVSSIRKNTQKVESIELPSDPREINH